MDSELPPVGQEGKLGNCLWFLYNQMSNSLARKLEAVGVSVAEWMVLRELYQVGEASPSNLARRLGMARGTVARITNRLKAKALLWCKSSLHKAHSHTLILTTSGRHLVPKLDALSGQNDMEFFGHLLPQDQKVVERILKEIMAHCSPHPGEGAT